MSYVELNMRNYDEDQVSELNEWGIWAFDRIATLERLCLERQNEIDRLNGLSRFTVQEICNYIESQDSLGDVAYNLSVENIEKANQK